MKRILAAFGLLLLASAAQSAQFKGLTVAVLNSTRAVAVAGGGGGGGGSDFTADDFTGTDGTALESHTPSGTGAAGTWNAGTANGIVLNTNRAVCNNGGSGFRYWNDSNPPSADYYVQADITVGASGNVSIGPAVRVSNSADTCYFVRWNNGSWELYGVSGGTVLNGGSPLGTYTGDDPSSATRTVKLSATGTTIAVTIGGVSRISVTDANIGSAGFAGLYSYYADASATRYLDNWSAR